MADQEDLAGGWRYRELSEETPMALWEEDFSEIKARLDQLRKQGVNDFRDYFRKEPEALLELDRHQIVPREARDFFVDMLVAVADGRKDFLGEAVGLNSQGEKLHLLYKWTVPPESHADYRRVLVAIVDMTQRVATEEKLKEIERLYRIIADNTQDVITIVGPDLNQRYASPSYMTVMGYDPEEITRGDYNPLDLIHPDDRGRAAQQMPSMFGEKQSTLFRFRGLHKDGHYSWFDTRSTPFYDENGEFIGALAVSWDVSDQVAAEESLRESNDRLKDFLSIAAHELRHPINLVQGYVETLRDIREECDPQVLDEIYEGVKRASKRLVNLVEELLEVSRIERERFVITREAANPRGLVEEAVSELRVRGVENAIEIEAAGGPETWALDHDKFRQLMVILLENAVNYSPAGSPVEVELQPGEEGLAVSVKDRGPGVEGDERERIFLRFHQVEEPRHHSVPGLGLGLYIAREIVEGHGGEIHHEPRPGGGSIFRFTIP